MGEVCLEVSKSWVYQPQIIHAGSSQLLSSYENHLGSFKNYGEKLLPVVYACNPGYLGG
jgi:hypothetical protein